MGRRALQEHLNTMHANLLWNAFSVQLLFLIPPGALPQATMSAAFSRRITGF